MRVTVQFAIVFVVLLALSGAGIAVAAAQVNVAQDHQHYAIEHANKVVALTDELASLAERETTRLLGLASGDSNATQLLAARSRFAATHAALEEELAAHSDDDDTQLVEVIEAIARLEHSFSENEGDRSIEQLLGSRAILERDLRTRTTSHAEWLDRTVDEWPELASSIAPVQASVAEQRRALADLERATGAAPDRARAAVLSNETFLLASAAMLELVGADGALADDVASLRPDDEPARVRAVCDAVDAESGPEPTEDALATLCYVVQGDLRVRRDAASYADVIAGIHEQTRATLGPRIDELDELATSARELATAEFAAELAEADEAVERAKQLAVVTLFAVVVPSGAIAAIVFHRMRKRLAAFDAAARAVSAGDFHSPAPARQDDEFDALAEAWESMTAALAAREKELATRSAHLQQTERMASLGSLLAGVAHEVNNPLAFIKSNEEMSLMDLDDLAARPSLQADPGASQIVGSMREATRANVDGIVRIERINRALKGFASPTRGERESVDLNDVVEGVLIIAHNRLKNRFRILRDYGTLPRVVVSPQEIGQIVLNLVINAAEASPDGGDIHVRTRVVGDRVQLSVADNGPGVPEEMKDKLFAPFATSKRGGTGLGLNISQGIAQAHGGSLVLDPIVEKGACFTLALPFTTPVPNARPSPP